MTVRLPHDTLSKKANNQTKRLLGYFQNFQDHEHVSSWLSIISGKLASEEKLTTEYRSTHWKAQADSQSSPIFPSPRSLLHKGDVTEETGAWLTSATHRVRPRLRGTLRCPAAHRAAANSARSLKRLKSIDVGKEVMANTNRNPLRTKQKGTNGLDCFRPSSIWGQFLYHRTLEDKSCPNSFNIHYI